MSDKKIKQSGLYGKFGVIQLDYMAIYKQQRQAYMGYRLSYLDQTPAKASSSTRPLPPFPEQPFHSHLFHADIAQLGK